QQAHIAGMSAPELVSDTTAPERRARADTDAAKTMKRYTQAYLGVSRTKNQRQTELGESA
ncbi:MAG TPA: hypothetical protein VGQ57_00110, partial [Polyangiaceae bacterium]|nr:hypothetical protein [Polyangiaceae bacterium]